MKKTIFVYLMALCASLLMACPSQAKTVKPDKPVDPNMGVLLLSATTDSFGNLDEVWYYYRLKGSDDKKSLDTYGSHIFSRPDDFPEDENKLGRLLATSLEPGEYELFDWKILFKQGFGTLTVTPKQAAKVLSFTIYPGKITYIGNFHVDSIKGKNIFGLSVAAGGFPVVADKSAEDMPLLKTKYPNLQDWPVEISVPDVKIWF